MQQIKQIYEDNTATHKVNIANQMLYINDIRIFEIKAFGKVLFSRYLGNNSVICFQFISFKLNTESQIVFGKIMAEQLYFFLAYIGLEISRCRETNLTNNSTELQTYLESSRNFLIKQLSLSLAKVSSV